ncbi:hypothetical protein PMAYCL1PPCAC_20576, partial [Pristionchus mayeri]
IGSMAIGTSLRDGADVNISICSENEEDRQWFHPTTLPGDDDKLLLGPALAVANSIKALLERKGWWKRLFARDSLDNVEVIVGGQQRKYVLVQLQAVVRKQVLKVDLVIGKTINIEGAIMFKFVRWIAPNNLFAELNIMLKTWRVAILCSSFVQASLQHELAHVDGCYDRCSHQERTRP